MPAGLPPQGPPEDPPRPGLPGSSPAATAAGAAAADGPPGPAAGARQTARAGVAGQAGAAGQAPPQRWFLLALATLQQAGLTGIRFGIPVLAPFIRADLDLSLTATGLVLGAFDLGALATFYLTGRLTDRYGDRRIMAAGAVLAGLLSLAAALDGAGLGMLLGLLVMAGTGFPSSQVAGSHAVIGWFPPRERGLAMGIRQAGLPAGGFAAAWLLPGLASAWGWRAALAGAAVACIASGVLVGLVLPRDEPGSVPRPRETGTGTGSGQRGGVAGAHSAACRPAGVHGGRSGRVQDPRAARAARGRDAGALAVAGWFFRQPTLVLVTAVACVLAAVQFSLTGYLPLFMEDVFGWSPDAAGRLLLVVHLGGMLGRLAWGWASDRLFGGQRAQPMAGAAFGGMLAAAALVAAALLGRPGGHSPVVSAAMVPLAALAGFNCLGWNGLYTTVVAENAGSRSAPALGLSMTVLYVFTMLAPPLFGRVVDAAGHYAAAWGLAVLLQLAGLVLIGRLHRRLAGGAEGLARGIRPLAGSS
ncbi:MFS transporter [Thermaerobacter sp. PB12/4term]|uniref:MFS transporter n=1 Tax=Thermaerobacter sp. PB12/4term TaxID=2293838 RepID=UPI001FAB7EA3|nr:MFS transporter [Thermaerobacter sp. PB12/4term]